MDNKLDKKEKITKFLSAHCLHKLVRTFYSLFKNDHRNEGKNDSYSYEINSSV